MFCMTTPQLASYICRQQCFTWSAWFFKSCRAVARQVMCVSVCVCTFRKWCLVWETSLGIFASLLTAAKTTAAAASLLHLHLLRDFTMWCIFRPTWAWMSMRVLVSLESVRNLGRMRWHHGRRQQQQPNTPPERWSLKLKEKTGWSYNFYHSSSSSSS